MKKILLMILTITLFSLIGCNDEIYYPLIVDEVSDASYFGNDKEVIRYKVYLKTDYNEDFYTSKRFNVGDTLK
jgi:uncharacterized lipoprotein NlpE involved in copper resistance